MYRKNSDNWKFAVIVLKFEWGCFTIKLCIQKNSDRTANSVDPDQTVALETVWPGSALFAKTCLSENLGSLQNMIWRICIPNEPPHDKINKMTVRSTKTQISLDICPVWSESLLCTHLIAKDPRFLHADSEDSDQTGWMPRLILSLRWAHMPFCWFDMRQLINTNM